MSSASRTRKRDSGGKPLTAADYRVEKMRYGKQGLMDMHVTFSALQRSF